MYARLSGILFPFALVVLIAVAFWGYKEHQDKNSVLIKAENQYQRAFHDLSFHMDRLQTELGNTMAVNSTSNDFYRKRLINVWKLTSEAQNEVGQLPLTLLPFSKTDEFLTNIANFTYQTAVRDLSKTPMDENEVKTLHSLYDRSKEISQDLRNVQTKALANNLRWMDVEMAVATENSKADNAIIDGFRTVDKKVGDYQDLNWGPSMTSLMEARSAKAPAGLDVSAEEVKQKAAQFLDIGNADYLQVRENGAGTEYNSFTVYGKDSSKPGGFQLDYTKKGGHMVSFTGNRDLGPKTLSIEQGREIAQAFLEEKGYKNLQAVNYDEYHNAAAYTFVKKEGGVLVFPQKLAAKVALDNGEVVGLEAKDYVYNQKDRKLAAPKLTEEQARKSISKDLQITDTSRVIIRNDLEQEVPCYQFIGKIKGTLYKLYINSDTGVEEKIETVGPVETEGQH